ncbi:MAG: DUF2203 family protein [Myxococcales bacterium]|nr:DUF2203 family protein [Myxococcales bacterium]
MILTRPNAVARPSILTNLRTSRLRQKRRAQRRPDRLTPRACAVMDLVMVPNDRAGFRVLSIEQANALVPELHRRVSEILAKNGRVQAMVGELQSRVRRAEDERSGRRVGSPAHPSGGHAVDVTVRAGDSAEVQQLKREIASRVQAIRREWSLVEELGAVVKDPRIGLVDFYGLVDARLVCLCWKHPETSIEHYHELDAGLASRKPLAAVRARSLN